MDHQNKVKPSSLLSDDLFFYFLAITHQLFCSCQLNTLTTHVNS